MLQSIIYDDLEEWQVQIREKMLLESVNDNEYGVDDTDTDTKNFVRHYQIGVLCFET